MFVFLHSIVPHFDDVGPALGRHSVLQGKSSTSHFHTPLNVDAFWNNQKRPNPTDLDGGHLWYKVLHTAHSFCMEVHDL